MSSPKDHLFDVVVPISGGKDSQASLKLAAQTFPAERILGLFCDTKFEHPKTYAHVEKLKTLYGNIAFYTLNGGDVLSKSLHYKRFPGGGARFCTDELKIRETKIFIRDLAIIAGGFEVWYGMRSGESPERLKRYAGKVCDYAYAPHEVMPSKYPKYLEKLGISFRLCILDWTTQDVMDFLSGEHNPLYDEGFDRVGCFPCLASGDKWKEKAFTHDDFGREQLCKVNCVAAQIGKSIWTSKGGKERNEVPCAICAI